MPRTRSGIRWEFPIIEQLEIRTMLSAAVNHAVAQFQMTPLQQALTSGRNQRTSSELQLTATTASPAKTAAKSAKATPATKAVSKTAATTPKTTTKTSAPTSNSTTIAGKPVTTATASTTSTISSAGTTTSNLSANGLSSDAASSEPYINEFEANNNTGLTDAAGSHPDWVEIYNPEGTNVNLAGWTLTDKDSGGDVTTTFTIPSGNATTGTTTGTTILAGGYKIIFCDAKNTINSSGEVHTNFKIDKSGGSLILTDPNGNVTSSYDPYPQQVSDVSYGIGPAVQTTTQLITASSPVKVTVPANGNFGGNWTAASGFDDSSWTSGTNGVGFDNPVALPAEIEPDESAAGADNATTNFVAQSGNTTYQLGIAGNVSANSDLDYFNIGALQAGDTLSVSMSGSSSSEGTLTNPFLSLYRGSAGGTLVTSDDNSGTGNDALIDHFAITTTDTYYVLAQSSGSASSGTYSLGISLTKTATNPVLPATGGNVTTETEPNNTGATATDLSGSWRQIQYTSHTTANLTSSSSLDYYQYAFTKGDLVSINLHATGNQHMAALLYKSDGTTVLASDADAADVRGTGFTKDAGFYSYIIPATGSYYVKAAGTAGGNYTVDLSLSSTTAPLPPGNNGTPIFANLINTNISTAMQGVNASSYVRIPFTITDPTQVTTLTLGMEYEDGFVAYLNGTEIERVNAGGTIATPLAYNATAASNRTDSSAATPATFDLSADTGLLTPGTNMLAIQGLNDSTTDSRFLIAPTLSFAHVISPAGIEYFGTPTPGAANQPGNLGQAADPKLSETNGFYTAPTAVTITDKSAGAQIRYTTDGTVPTATTGTVYTGPITISQTTPLRAAAFVPGYIASNTITATYLFLAQVATQTVPSTAYPASSYPTTWAGDQATGGTGAPSGSYPADYNINQAISNPTGQSWTSANFNAGLTQIPTISIVTAPANLFAPPVLDGNGNPISGGIYQLPQEEGNAWQIPVSITMINPDGSTAFEENAGMRTQGATSRNNSHNPKHSLRVLFQSEYGNNELSYPMFGPGSAGLDTIDFRGTYNNSWTHTTSTDPNDAQRSRAEYARDGWNRLTQGAMGDLGLPSKYVQIYLNGLYWGVYDATDRPESSYFATQLGGVADNYEVLNAGTPVNSPEANPNETATDWANLNTMIDQTTVVNGQTVPYVSTAAGYAAVSQLVDTKNLADYILQMTFAGNTDWDAGGHNWYVYKNATIPGDGFKFIAWDSEHTLEATTDNITGVNTTNAPSHIFHQLLNNAEFKLMFSDEVHKFLFDNGALTPAANEARYAGMTNQITNAIVDESARWGNYESAYRGIGTTVYTKDNWTASVNTILNTYFPVRTANALAQYQAAGWYPSAAANAAPEFNQYGGSVTSGFQLTMTGSGVVYYTINGTDPRVTGGAVSASALTYNSSSPPAITSSEEVKARTLVNGVWSPLTDFSFYVGAPPALRISEVMYHAPNPPSSFADQTSDDYEYLELQNTGSTPIALANFTLSSGVRFTFPSTAGTLQPGAYTVVVQNLAAFQARYGNSIPVAGTYVGDLDNSTDEIVLTSPYGQAVEDFTYQDSWYGDTDGGGYSLVAVNPSATNAVLSTAAGWRPSTQVNGEPGAADPGVNGGAVVINELLSNSNDAGDTATGDWIELANTTSSAINVGSWYLSNDSTNLKMYQIPAGTTIPANGYLTLTQNANFGAAFTLADAGGSLFFTEGDTAGDILGYQQEEDFGAADPGVTHGTYLDSTGNVDFPQLSAATFGAANALPKIGPVVISEVMYDPASGGSEYIKLQNITNAPVNLFDPANPANTWQFTNGISYTFPQNSVIPAHGTILVVPTTASAFTSTYAVPSGVQVFGPYTGALNNAGESVTLSKPGTPVNGVAPYITVDHVDYDNAAPWPATPYGTGPSLERINLFSFADDPINWTAGPAGGTLGAANTTETVPTISSFGVNAGAGQRSMVTSITVSFSGPIASLDAGAFTLQTSSGGVLSPAAATITPAISTDGLSVKLTFSGTGVSAGSLADGRYVLTAHASLIRDIDDTTLSADQTFNFIRFFGDINGDGTVNGTDYRAFFQAYLQTSPSAAYNAAFDINGDGTINGTDYRAFFKNYLQTLP